MATKTSHVMLPDHKTYRFTLPSGGTVDAKSALIRDPKKLEAIVDGAAALTPAERHILMQLLQAMPS